MYKRLLTLALLALIPAVVVVAGGRKQNVSHEAEDPLGFSEIMDTGQKKPGKYNFYLEARDKGGNTAKAGPHNIYIDPDSDKPIVTIANPLEKMHVQGNLNIVGTCVDDDAVDYVELWFNDDMDTLIRAEGAGFWSYYYDTSGMADGLYSVSARGVDVNGLPGHPKRVTWHLDRKKPETKVSSHELGALVSGKVVMKGTVHDGNGVNALSYSLDGGKRYTPIPIKSDKKSMSTFEMTLDTKTFDDGPLVIWFRARDNMGTRGAASHLLFVDNTGPDVDITYPGPGDKAGGKLTVAGYAMDTVGLKSLSWKLGSQSGDFELVKGNPWWVKEFDVRGQRASSLDFEVRAVDLSGNVSVAKRKLALDAGLPKVTLESPAASTTLEGDVLILTGEASGDTPIASILFSLNGQAAIEVPCSGKFRLAVPGLLAGTHSMNVWAKDIFGLEGAKVQVKGIISRGAAGNLDGGPTMDIAEGMNGAWARGNMVLKFTPSGGEGRLTAVEYSADLGNTWKPLLQANELAGGRAFEKTIDLSAEPDGALTVMARATDDASRQVVKYFNIIKDTVAPEPSVAAPSAESRVNGAVTLGMAVKEAGRIKTVTYERPAVSSAGRVTKPALSKVVYTAEGSNDYVYFVNVLMDPQTMPLDSSMRFVFTDFAGNSAVLNSWPFTIDDEMDVPVVQINLPLHNEVVTTDFVISGITYDDDGIKCIYWNIDKAAPQMADASNGYSIPVALSTLTDNEHTVTVVAEDIYGVRSKPETRVFRVSLEEPKAKLVQPSFDQIVKGAVRLSGTASDGNRIGRIQISLDNGITYNDATGAENWTYDFNSTIINDGTHVVFIRAVDNYEITAMYSSLINIDNTAPEVFLYSPRDGATTAGMVEVTGRAVDNILMKEIAIEVRSLDGQRVPANLARRSVAPSSILKETLDLSPLVDGLYNVEVWAIDKADNITRVSRNLQLSKNSLPNYVDVLYPFNGEYVQGKFNLYGITGGVDKARTVSMLINGHAGPEPVEVNETGYYRFSLGPDEMDEGLNRITVSSDFGGRRTVTSAVRTLNYHKAGAWVTIDSMSMGDFAFERPWLTGRAGYVLSDEDVELLADKSVPKEQKADAKTKVFKSVDLSFDNGQTFVAASKTTEKDSDWHYRLENGDMPEGMHYLIVRANMVNGEVALSRTLVQVDKTNPVIRLVSPAPGGIYNTSLEYTALASDDVALKDVTYYLRVGDKASYEIPGFIQGLYFDMTIPAFLRLAFPGEPSSVEGGANSGGYPAIFAAPTFMDVGMGLSFFDDNVKVQVQYGFMPQAISVKLGLPDMKYGGNVLGLKLLANLYTLPFGLVAGPDWEWLYASFALGANFSLFSISQSERPTWLSAIIAQIELPKITIPKRKYLRTFSLFTEGQLWFNPTDVDDPELKLVVPHVIMGLRMYIF